MKKMYVMAGTNGAGKSSSSRFIIPENVKYLNPDLMVKNFHKENEGAKDLDAWKHVVKEIKSHINEEKSFAFETTLSDKTVLAKMETAQKNGFEVNLVHISLDNVETHYQRVADRVSKGGHDIPKEVIDRRFNSSDKNLPAAMALADKAVLYNNTNSLEQIVALEKGKITYQAPELPGHIEKSLNEFKLHHEKPSEIELPHLNTKYKEQWAADLDKANIQENSATKAEKAPELSEQEFPENLDKGMER